VFFCIVYEGETGDPHRATPVIASADPAIVAAVADAFSKKLGARTPPRSGNSAVTRWPS